MKSLIVTKIFHFDAAHNLIAYHGKCEKLHGHTYKLCVSVKGTLDEEGMVLDFAVLKQIVTDRVLKILDHSYINDIIEQPSAENIAIWIWQSLYDSLCFDNCTLYEIQVWETQSSFATYNG